MAEAAGYIQLTIKIWPEDDQWSAVCEELGTAACGDDLGGVYEAIRDMIALHLNSLEKMGVRKSFFKEHGITLHKTEPTRVRRLRVSPNELVMSQTERIPLVAAAV